MTTHFCPDNPGKERWVPGRVTACPHHEHNRARRPVKFGRKTRARMDREAGSVGVDRGGFISGH